MPELHGPSWRKQLKVTPTPAPFTRAHPSLEGESPEVPAPRVGATVQRAAHAPPAAPSADAVDRSGGGQGGAAEAEDEAQDDDEDGVFLDDKGISWFQDEDGIQWFCGPDDEEWSEYSD